MLKHILYGVFSLVLLTACGNNTSSISDTSPQVITESATDLSGIKTYAANHVTQMKAATSNLHQIAQTYYDNVVQIKAENPQEDPYKYYWAHRPAEVADLLTQAKEAWMAANVHYELNEGIVAGVPSLVYYDAWIDAGPSGAEDPAEALDWQLELPDGRILEKPGNFFHHLTEPILWGTQPDFVGLAVDLDGDGQQEIGEALPEANVFLAAAKGLDEATTELNQAITNWEPTPEDAFTALVTMVPTMNEYFEQWKLSVFVSGQASTQENFVAVSRLLDITGILNGLDVTYDNVKPTVSQANPALSDQIDIELDTLVTYVNDLYEREQQGKQFTPEDADIFGSKAQDDATALAGQIAQAAALLDVEIAE